MARSSRRYSNLDRHWLRAGVVGVSEVPDSCHYLAHHFCIGRYIYHHHSRLAFSPSSIISHPLVSVLIVILVYSVNISMASKSPMMYSTRSFDVGLTLLSYFLFPIIP